MYTSFNARAVGLTLPAGRTIELAARHGFGGVDLLVRDLVGSGEDPVRLRGRMDELGLRGGAWPLPVCWRGDEATYRADLARLPDLAKAARTLGLRRTGTWVMPETPGTDIIAAFEFHVDRLGPIARILADQGVAIGLEVIGVESFRSGAGQPLFIQLGDPLVDRLLDQMREFAPHIGIIADAFHLQAAREPIGSALKRGADAIIWAHVADLPRDFGGERRSIRDNDRGLPDECGGGRLQGIFARLSGSRLQGASHGRTDEP